MLSLTSRGINDRAFQDLIGRTPRTNTAKTVAGFVFVQNVTISTGQVEGHDVCRVNVPRATEPMWSTFKGTEKLFVRRNNSTRAVPDGEIEAFIAERFGPDHATEGEAT